MSTMRRGLAPVALIVALAAACGGSPMAPLPGGPPVPTSSSFEGVWNLKYRTDVCEGDRNCFAMTGRTVDFSVRLMRAGGAYVGVVMLSGSNVDVTGVIDDGGSLVLTGLRRAAVQYDAHVEARLALRQDAGTIAGDLELNGPGLSPPFYAHWRRAGPIVSAARAGEINSSVSDFAGTWTGNATVRRCSSAAPQNCDSVPESDVRSFELTLTQSPGGVTGLLMDPREAPVDGTVAGGTMLLSGVREQKSDSRLFNVVTTVRPSNLTRDAVGRLKGTLSIEVRSFYTDLGVITYDYLFDLIDVALRPPS
jgi:hypothetical protein